jgi:hypothetical protein
VLSHTEKQRERERESEREKARGEKARETKEKFARAFVERM